MGNKTITVRFDPQLYSRIIHHDMNKSDIIRQGVRLFFQKEESAKQTPGWTQAETKNVGQDISQTSTPQAAVDRSSPSSFPSDGVCRSIDETLQLMDKLKSEIDQLDQDLYSWMKTYEAATKQEDKYKTLQENIDALKPRW
jgi:hypothetical protein